MTSRRNFIALSAMSALTASAQSVKAWIPAITRLPPKASSLQLSMAGYTFFQFDVPHTIAMMQRVNVSTLSLKDVHLPLDSSPEKINEVVGLFRKGGIEIYAVGVIYLSSREQVDRAFEYAKRVGVNLMVGVPAHDLLAYAEEKVKEYNIRLAIHNHGPEDKLYPTPDEVYTRIKNLDPRVGMCLDIGHTQRAGIDPTSAFKKYRNRIFDLHIKDVDKAEKNAKTVEMGRGIIDLPAFVRALYKAQYTGHCSIEFEKDMKDPLPGIAESVGYFRALAKVLS